MVEDLGAEIPHLRRFARRMIWDPSRADDLVQQCLLQALENARQWRPGSNLRGWLYVILRNTFCSEMRRARRHGETFVNTATAPEPTIPGDQESYFSLAEVARACDQLAADQREVLYLIVVEGCCYEDAAKALDVPIGTVRSRLARAREALRRLVGEPPKRRPRHHRS
jgi:RNA polymerase sigma-70 factor, ECF subfamily